MKVLAVGATGKFAGLVVPELKKRGVTVRALVREPKLESRAREQGAAEIAVGDLENAASLRAALYGVDGVFHINPAFAPRESEMGVAMMEASRAAGVRRFVFSGVIHPALPMINHQAKLAVEEALYRSGMNFTVLQPAAFFQNIEGAWETIVRMRRYTLPYSAQQKLCYVDYRDVAECAALAFTTDRLDYGTFELCGPGMFDRNEVAALISEAAGVPVEAAQAPFDLWVSNAGIPAGPLRYGLDRMFAEYDRHGLPGGNPLILRSILQREPRALRQFVEELASRHQQTALPRAS